MANLLKFELIRSKCEKMNKNIIHLLFPLTNVRNLIGPTCLQSVFGKYDDLVSIVSNSMMFIMLIVILCTGYRIPIFDEYKPFKSDLFSKIGVLICAGQSFSATEIIILRTWTFFKVREYNSPENVPFVLMIKKLKSKDHKIILFCLQFASILVNTSGIFGHFIMLVIDSYHTNDTFKYIITCYYIIGYTLVIRNGARGVMIMFAYSVAGFRIVLSEIKELNRQMELYPSEINQVLRMYNDLTISIEQLTLLIKILMLTSNLLVVPTFSFVVIIAITPVHDVFTFISQIIFIFAATLYSVRGYFLVAAMSKIASESKILMKKINSIIAGSSVQNTEHVIRLNMILDDVSCSRSRIIIHEFNSPINQMDVFHSIVSTISNVILIFTLVNSVNSF